MKKDALKTSIIPLGDRILVKPLSQEDGKTTASGIIIPDTSREDKPDRGKVIATGEGRTTDEGKTIAPRVKKGDTVLFQWGEKIKIEGVEYYVVSENNILAIIK